MTEPLVKEMKNQGISLFLEEQVVSLSENETAVVETERRRENYDLVLLANHSRPDNQMWEEQLTLNDDGTIWVDDYLQTSQKTSMQLAMQSKSLFAQQMKKCTFL